MAEIPIERKSGSRAWIWIVALILIAAIAWMLLSRDDDARRTAPAGEVGALQQAPAVTAPLVSLHAA